jgi:hypothetical protein
MDAHQEKMDAKIDVNQERFEAEMKTAQENTDTNLKEMVNIKTQIDCLASRTDVNQETAEDWLGEVDAWRKGETACQDATEACLKRRRPT